MTMHDNDRAAAIVFHDDQILLMYRKTGDKEYFVFPGGHIEKGETREMAVVREIDEEASIKVGAGRLLYVLHHDKLKIPDTHYFFLCEYIRGNPALRTDTNEYRENLEGHEYHEPMWLKLSELSRPTVYPLEVRDRLLLDLKNGYDPDVVDLQFVHTYPGL